MKSEFKKQVIPLQILIPLRFVKQTYDEINFT